MILSALSKDDFVSRGFAILSAPQKNESAFRRLNHRESLPKNLEAAAPHCIAIPIITESAGSRNGTFRFTFHQCFIRRFIRRFIRVSLAFYPHFTRRFIRVLSAFHQRFIDLQFEKAFVYFNVFLCA